MRPVIGITTRPRTVPSSLGDSAADTLQHTYRDAVMGSEGIPVLLAPVAAEDVPVVLDRIDGLLLTGGGDLHPRHYGGRGVPENYGIDDTRDVFELELARQAAARGLPTLAICRGLQVVNVAFGGTLIEDIPTEIGTDHSLRGEAVFDRHQPISLLDGCRLAGLFGADKLEVNSIHHQSVRDLAPGFRATAWSSDGVIEAIEHEGDWPLVAVQWHPEYLHAGSDPQARIVFDELVRMART